MCISFIFRCFYWRIYLFSSDYKYNYANYEVKMANIGNYFLHHLGFMQ